MRVTSMIDFLGRRSDTLKNILVSLDSNINLTYN